MEEVSKSEDGRYKVFENGVILDTKTNLEWYVGPDRHTSHYNAQKWVDELNSKKFAGGGWRMPRIEELAKIYESGKVTAKTSRGWEIHIDPVFKITGPWIWSSELVDEDGNSSENRNSPLARNFALDHGYIDWDYRTDEGYYRGIAVREIHSTLKYTHDKE